MRGRGPAGQSAPALDTARSHYYGGAPAATGPQPSAQTPTASAVRWRTIPALDRLVSYDSTQPCTGPCTPAPIDWRHRPPPRPLTEAAVREITRRIHQATAHPRLAAALVTTLLTRASFQQLLTVRAEDLGPDAATLAFHDPARYTDGCALHPIPAWARPFLSAAASFAALTDSRELLARQDERPHILHLSENARLRPPQPPQPAGASGVVWDWAERGQAERYETLLSRHRKPSRPCR